MIDCTSVKENIQANITIRHLHEEFLAKDFEYKTCFEDMKRLNTGYARVTQMTFLSDFTDARYVSLKGERPGMFSREPIFFIQKRKGRDELQTVDDLAIRSAHYMFATPPIYVRILFYERTKQISQTLYAYIVHGFILGAQGSLSMFVATKTLLPGLVDPKNQWKVHYYSNQSDPIISAWPIRS